MGKKEKKEKVKQSLMCKIMFILSCFVSVVCLFAVFMAFFLGAEKGLYAMVGGIATALICWLAYKSLRYKPEPEPVKISFDYGNGTTKKSSKEDEKEDKKMAKGDFKDVKTVEEVETEEAKTKSKQKKAEPKAEKEEIKEEQTSTESKNKDEEVKG